MQPQVYIRKKRILEAWKNDYIKSEAVANQPVTEEAVNESVVNDKIVIYEQVIEEVVYDDMIIFEGPIDEVIKAKTQNDNTISYGIIDAETKSAEDMIAEALIAEAANAEAKRIESILSPFVNPMRNYDDAMSDVSTNYESTTDEVVTDDHATMSVALNLSSSGEEHRQKLLPCYKNYDAYPNEETRNDERIIFETHFSTSGEFLEIYTSDSLNPAKTLNFKGNYDKCMAEKTSDYDLTTSEDVSDDERTISVASDLQLSSEEHWDEFFPIYTSDDDINTEVENAEDSIAKAANAKANHIEILIVEPINHKQNSNEVTIGDPPTDESTTDEPSTDNDATVSATLGVSSIGAGMELPSSSGEHSPNLLAGHKNDFNAMYLRVSLLEKWLEDMVKESDKHQQLNLHLLRHLEQQSEQKVEVSKDYFVEELTETQDFGSLDYLEESQKQTSESQQKQPQRIKISATSTPIKETPTKPDIIEKIAATEDSLVVMGPNGTTIAKNADAINWSATSTPIKQKPYKPEIMKKFVANEDGLVVIGPNGTTIAKKALAALNWSLAGPALTRKILMEVFDRETLAFHNLTGKPSPAFMDCDKPIKSQLDPIKVADVIYFVREHTKLSAKEVRNTITTKCADENKMYRQRQKKKQMAALKLQQSQEE